MTAAQVSVVRAFRHSGGLKAGTPSEMASTPGQRHGTGAEGPQQQEEAERLRSLGQRSHVGGAS